MDSHAGNYDYRAIHIAYSVFIKDYTLTRKMARNVVTFLSAEFGVDVDQIPSAEETRKKIDILANEVRERAREEAENAPHCWNHIPFSWYIVPKDMRIIKCYLHATLAIAMLINDSGDDYNPMPGFTAAIKAVKENPFLQNRLMDIIMDIMIEYIRTIPVETTDIPF